MGRLTKNISKKTGLSPGTLIHVGEKLSEKTEIKLFDYDESSLNERDFKIMEEFFELKESPSTTWINIDGLHDISIIEKLGEVFQLHPLLLEDVLNTNQRPKIEEYENCIFIVLKMLYFDPVESKLSSEQISIVMGDTYLISFEEKSGNLFDPIKERLRKNNHHLRKTSPDYLCYSLMDIIVDHYFSILEKIEEKIEDMEEKVIQDASSEMLQSIYNLKREMIFLRKAIWPLREVLNKLQIETLSRVDRTTTLYFKDLYDHTIQIIDTIESFRDLLGGMHDTYLSSISNKMNSIMKILTIFSTIFIPLTFIVGVYGMNFESMPELKWRWAYPSIWILMLSITVSMLFFFKNKKWF